MNETKYLVSRVPLTGQAPREFSVDDGRRFTWVTNQDEATNYGRNAFNVVRLLNSEQVKGGSYQYSVFAVTNNN